MSSVVLSRRRIKLEKIGHIADLARTHRKHVTWNKRVKKGMYALTCAHAYVCVLCVCESENSRGEQQTQRKHIHAILLQAGNTHAHLSAKNIEKVVFTQVV